MPEADATVRPLIVLPADPEHLSLGGIASFVRGFVKYSPNDFDISVIGLSRSRPTGHWAGITLEGRFVRFLPVARVDTSERRVLPLALRYTLGLALHRPDLRSPGRILQFHRPATGIPLLRSPLPAVRVVHQTLDQLRAVEGESKWRWTGPLLRLFETAALARMDQIYLVDEHGAEEYRDKFPHLRERITYLPNWVDDGVFGLLPDDARPAHEAEFVRSLDLDPGSELVLYAGRLERTKRPALLLQAYRRLLQRRPRARLLIAGAGSLLRQTQETAGRLGVLDHVRFLGLLPREELARVMNVARVLMISSLSETGPTVGIEALACGLPVVMTPVGQVSRIVEMRDTGWVTSRHDPDELAEGVAWVLDHIDEEMRRRCARSVEQFSAQSVLPRLYQDHRALAHAERDTLGGSPH